MCDFDALNSVAVVKLSTFAKVLNGVVEHKYEVRNRRMEVNDT